MNDIIAQHGFSLRTERSVSPIRRLQPLVSQNINTRYPPRVRIDVLFASPCRHGSQHSCSSRCQAGSGACQDMVEVSDEDPIIDLVGEGRTKTRRTKTKAIKSTPKRRLRRKAKLEEVSAKIAPKQRRLTAKQRDSVSVMPKQPNQRAAGRVPNKAAKANSKQCLLRTEQEPCEAISNTSRCPRVADNPNPIPTPNPKSRRKAMPKRSRKEAKRPPITTRGDEGTRTESGKTNQLVLDVTPPSRRPAPRLMLTVQSPRIGRHQRIPWRLKSSLLRTPLAGRSPAQIARGVAMDICPRELQGILPISDLPSPPIVIEDVRAVENGQKPSVQVQVIGERGQKPSVQVQVIGESGRKLMDVQVVENACERVGDAPKRLRKRSETIRVIENAPQIGENMQAIDIAPARQQVRENISQSRRRCSENKQTKDLPQQSKPVGSRQRLQRPSERQQTTDTPQRQVRPVRNLETRSSPQRQARPGGNLGIRSSPQRQRGPGVNLETRSSSRREDKPNANLQTIPAPQRYERPEKNLETRSSPQRQARPGGDQVARSSPQRPERPGQHLETGSSPQLQGRPGGNLGTRSTSRREDKPSSNLQTIPAPLRQERPGKNLETRSSPPRQDRPDRNLETRTSPQRQAGQGQNLGTRSSPRRRGRPRKKLQTVDVPQCQQRTTANLQTAEVPHFQRLPRAILKAVGHTPQNKCISSANMEAIENASKNRRRPSEILHATEQVPQCQLIPGENLQAIEDMPQPQRRPSATIKCIEDAPQDRCIRSDISHAGEQAPQCQLVFSEHLQAIANATENRRELSENPNDFEDAPQPKPRTSVNLKTREDAPRNRRRSSGIPQTWESALQLLQRASENLQAIEDTPQPQGRPVANMQTLENAPSDQRPPIKIPELRENASINRQIFGISHPPKNWHRVTPQAWGAEQLLERDFQAIADSSMPALAAKIPEKAPQRRSTPTSDLRITDFPTDVRQERAVDLPIVAHFLPNRKRARADAHPIRNPPQKRKRPSGNTRAIENSPRNRIRLDCDAQEQKFRRSWAQWTSDQLMETDGQEMVADAVAKQISPPSRWKDSVDPLLVASPLAGSHAGNQQCQNLPQNLQTAMQPLDRQPQNRPQSHTKLDRQQKLAYPQSRQARQMQDVPRESIVAACPMRSGVLPPAASISMPRPLVPQTAFRWNGHAVAPSSPIESFGGTQQSVHCQNYFKSIRASPCFHPSQLLQYEPRPIPLSPALHDPKPMVGGWQERLHQAQKEYLSDCVVAKSRMHHDGPARCAECTWLVLDVIRLPAAVIFSLECSPQLRKRCVVPRKHVNSSSLANVGKGDSVRLSADSSANILLPLLIFPT